MNLIDTNLVLAIGFGTTEIMILTGVVLLIFGSSKLPTLMRNMGRSVNEFKAGIKDAPRESTPAVEEEKVASEVSESVAYTHLTLPTIYSV